MIIRVDKRMTQEEIGPHAPTYLAVWLFFQIAAGHVALPILAATLVFAKSVRKVPALVVVCITWIISGVSSTLLFYVGQHTGPEPGKGLCIAQASLLGAVPPMACTAMFILAYHVARAYDSPDPEDEPSSTKTFIGRIALLIVPFVVFGVFVAIGVNIALQHPDQVNRSQEYFHCSLDWLPFSTAVDVISTLICAATLTLEGVVVITSMRYWSLLRTGQHLTDDSISFITRVVVFTVYLTASTVINLISTAGTNVGILPDMLSASVGLALFFIFVSRWRILRAWAFWKSQPETINVFPAARDSLTPVPKRRRHQSSLSQLHSLESSGSTLYTGHSSQTLPHYYEPKYQGGPQIIGRPSEAFSTFSVPKSDRRRDTIATWGFRE